MDQAWASYEGPQTRFVPYWERSPLYTVRPAPVLGSLYLRPDRALLALGSQSEDEVACEAAVGKLLARLPRGVSARDAVTGETLEITGGKLAFPLAGRGWRMVELREWSGNR